MAGGAAGGATQSALSGGNVGQGALIGGISGGIAGGIGISIKGWDWIPRGIVQVGAGALVGGTVAQLTGGKFYQGALMGALSGAVGFTVSELIGVYLPTIKQLQAMVIQKLGQEAEILSENATERGFRDPIKFGDMTPEETDWVKNLYDSTKNIFSPNITIPRSIDFGNDPGRFGALHVRFDDLNYHVDNYDLVMDPFRHIAEYLYQKYINHIE
jgi:hypothetical protein